MIATSVLILAGLTGLGLSAVWALQQGKPDRVAAVFLVVGALAGLVFGISWTVNSFVGFTMPGTFWDFFCQAARVSLWPSLFLAIALAGCGYIFSMPKDLSLGAEKTRVGYLRERKDAVYDNLRDLNFEYQAGKVPEVDYQQMKYSLQDEAAAILAEIARLENNPAPQKGM